MADEHVKFSESGFVLSVLSWLAACVHWSAEYDDKRDNMVSQTSAEAADDIFLGCLIQLVSK